MGRVESPASFSASPPPFPIHSSPKETRWRGKSYETELPFPSEGGSFPFPARSVAQSRHRTESATYWGGRGSSAPRSPPHAAAPPSRAREKEGAEGGLAGGGGLGRHEWASGWHQTVRAQSSGGVGAFLQPGNRASRFGGWGRRAVRGEPGGAEAAILWCRDKSGTVGSDGRPGRPQREASPPRPPLEAAAPRADGAAVAGTDQRRGGRRSVPSSSWPRRVVPGGLRPISELFSGPPSRPQARWPGRSLAWRQQRLTHPRSLCSPRAAWRPLPAGLNCGGPPSLCWSKRGWRVRSARALATPQERGPRSLASARSGFQGAELGGPCWICFALLYSVS